MLRSDESARHLDARRREQTPQALARLAVVGLFISLWGVLWIARIPMPRPFLAVLVVEALFFIAYWRFVWTVRSVSVIGGAHYLMLLAEIVFHTTMVYFLGGITWLGAFAYVFGLIFTNTFLDLRRGFVYTLAAAAAFVALAVLDATAVIPHYTYLEQSELRYTDARFLVTTALGGAGVFFSIYVWVNWVGHRLRQERNAAVRMQDELAAARDQLEARVRDRTAELQAANAALSENEDLLRATIESTADGILVVDGAGKAAYSNARFAEMWRIDADVIETGDDDRLIQSVLHQLVDPEQFLGKVRELYGSTREDFDTLQFTDGRVFERYSRPLSRDGDAPGRVWSFRDVTQRARAEDILREQAHRDSLTGVLNHAAITHALRQHAVRRDAGGSLAIVMLDIDGMKSVNDAYGHQVGDAALLAVSRTLSRDGALVGRYGGDEFLVVLPGASRREAEAYRDGAFADLDRVTIAAADEATRVPVLASAGIAIFPEEAETVEEAIRLADNAMYREKRERQAALAGHARPSLADERAAKMIGELVPLLTSPGALAEKLRLVGHRLSVGAGYDVVRFDTSMDGPERTQRTFARLPDGYTRSWEDEQEHEAGAGLRAMLARLGRPFIVDRLAESELLSAGERLVAHQTGLRSAVVVPMLWQDRLVGMLTVASRRESGLDARDVQFLTSVAAQVTAIIQTEVLVAELREATTSLREARAETVVLLAAAAEAHDATTGRHLQRVEAISVALARELGYDDERAEAVGLAAVLHDIGKVRVPDTILLSPSQLADDEWEIMKQHTTWGGDLLAGRPGFELAAEIAAAHHERWDGSGYPLGLVGEAIPEAATIVSVADSLDAITSDRPYRLGRDGEWAVKEIVRCSGRQFSPRVVEALLRLHARRALPLRAPEAPHRLAA